MRKTALSSRCGSSWPSQDHASKAALADLAPSWSRWSCQELLGRERQIVLVLGLPAISSLPPFFFWLHSVKSSRGYFSRQGVKNTIVKSPSLPIHSVDRLLFGVCLHLQDTRPLPNQVKTQTRCPALLENPTLRKLPRGSSP